MAGSGAMSPSIEKTPSTTTRTPPPSLGRALQHLLELVEPVVAERAQLGPRQDAAVEDRGVVAGVDDHRVARRQDRAERPDVGLVAGGEDDRVLGAHEVGDLGLELEVHLRRAVEQARAGHAGAVLGQRVARAGDDALVLGQPEVVVAAEHDPGLALHLDDGPRRALHHPEVGHHVDRAGGLEDLETLVVASLLEDVDLRLCRHGKSVLGGPSLGSGVDVCRRASRPLLPRRRRVHRPALPPARRHAVGPAAQAGAAPVPQPPPRAPTPSASTSSCSSPSATGAWSAA